FRRVLFRSVVVGLAAIRIDDLDDPVRQRDLGEGPVRPVLRRLAERVVAVGRQRPVPPLGGVPRGREVQQVGVPGPTAAGSALQVDGAALRAGPGLIDPVPAPITMAESAHLAAGAAQGTVLSAHRPQLADHRRPPLTYLGQVWAPGLTLLSWNRAVDHSESAPDRNDLAAHLAAGHARSR